MFSTPIYRGFTYFRGSKLGLFLDEKGVISDPFWGPQAPFGPLFDPFSGYVFTPIYRGKYVFRVSKAGRFWVHLGSSGGSEGPFLTPFRGTFSTCFCLIGRLFGVRNQVDFGPLRGSQTPEGGQRGSPRGYA